MLYEDLGQALAMSSVEFQEGLAALQDKRRPEFSRAASADPQTDGLPSSILSEDSR